MDEMFEMYGNADQVLQSFVLMPVLEFSAIVFLVLITYLAVHNLNSSWHQLVKFSIAILFGTVGYAFGKFAIIVFLLQPLLTFAQ